MFYKKNQHQHLFDRPDEIDIESLTVWSDSYTIMAHKYGWDEPDRREHHHVFTTDFEREAMVFIEMLFSQIQNLKWEIEDLTQQMRELKE